MIKINLTKDILQVLPLIKITKVDDDTDIKSGIEIKSTDLFWGGTVLENIMQAWGFYEDNIEHGDEGKIWNRDLEQKAWDTYDYIIKNLDNIISIILYTPYNMEIKEGVYSRNKKTPGIWIYSESE